MLEPASSWQFPSSCAPAERGHLCGVATEAPSQFVHSAVRSPAMCRPPDRTLVAADGRLRIGLLSEVFQFWMSPVMRLRGQVTADSLPRLPPEDSAAELLDSFERLWGERSHRADGRGATVREVVIRLLTPRFQLITLWGAADLAANVAQPLIVAAIVRNLRLGTSGSFDYALVVVLTATAVVNTTAIQQVLWNGARVGMRAKIALSAAIYSKTLRLSNAAMLHTSAGQATNLVAIDVARLEMSFTFLFSLFTAPATVTAVAVLVGREVGAAPTVTGMAFVVGVFALQAVVARKISRIRSRVVKLTDSRVKLMQDVLMGSEALKVNGWEAALTKRVRALRSREQRNIFSSFGRLAMLEAIIFFAPGVATFLILMVRYAQDPDGDLRVEKACALHLAAVP